MEIIGALIAGSAIGAVLGFVGAGGAMLSVPILMYGFGFDAKSATTAALAIVFLAALSGAIPKARKGHILYRDALVIVGLGLITNFGFATIADDLPDSFITTGFALVLILAGLSMLRNPKFSEHTRMPIPILIVISLAIGTITGLFGIGGGFLAIPILILFYNVAPARAAGTSLFIIMINTLTGFFAHFRHWDEVNWLIPSIIALIALIVSRYASHHSSRLSPVTLKRSFAYFVFAIALFTLLETWVVT